MEITTKGAKETYELFKGLGNAAVKGWAVIKDNDSFADWLADAPDLIPIISDDFVPALKGAAEIGNEFREDPIAVVVSAVVATAETVREFTKDDEPAPEA